MRRHSMETPAYDSRTDRRPGLPSGAAWTRREWLARAGAGFGMVGLSSVLAEQGLLAADAGGIVVACGEGALRLTELQKPGGRRVTSADFLHGNPLHPD